MLEFGIWLCSRRAYPRCMPNLSKKLFVCIEIPNPQLRVKTGKPTHRRNNFFSMPQNKSKSTIAYLLLGMSAASILLLLERADNKQERVGGEEPCYGLYFPWPGPWPAHHHQLRVDHRYLCCLQEAFGRRAKNLNALHHLLMH